LIYEFNFSSIDEAAAVGEEAAAVGEEAQVVDEEAPVVDGKEDAPGTIYNRFFHFINTSIDIIF